MTVSVRYIVDDVEACIPFYTALGFEVALHPAPTFAMLARAELRLLLNQPGAGGAGMADNDGNLPEPGGWNRIQIEVPDIEQTADELREAGVRFRRDVVTGQGGKQALIEDPSGNLVELFQGG